MNILGAFTITTLQQRTLAAGGVIEIPRASLMPKILRQAKIGDLFWVKEPFVEFKSRGQCPRPIHVIVAGSSPLNLNVPADLKPVQHLCRMRFHQAVAMDRADSRATLEIMTIGEHTVRCLVHLLPFPEVMKAWRAAQ